MGPLGAGDERGDSFGAARVWRLAPAPVTSLPGLAEALGLGSLTVKRDDLLVPLCGGSKVRKLDLLLATPRFTAADTWHSVGALGSGHLVTAAGAAAELGHRFVAHCFWEPPLADVYAKLAYTASVSSEVRAYSSRVALVCRRPDLLVGLDTRGAAVIPPGASCAAGAAGMAEGAHELARQVRSGELPTPDVAVVALGSGGCAAGLALGLALAGLPTRVLAIAVVERPLTPSWRLRALIRAAARFMAAHGVPEAMSAARRARCQIVRGYVGPGYGRASAASQAACLRLAPHDLALEPIYTGKAMAALLALAPRLVGAQVLFWNTTQRALPAAPEDWQTKLPPALARRLAAALAHTPAA